MKKTYLGLLLGASLATQGAYAQSFTDYAWKEASMPAAPAIPAEFQNAEAVIFKSETYSRGVFSGEYPYIEQLGTYRTQTHLKLLKEEAVKEYKRIAIPRFRGQIGDYVQVKEYDIRIRKGKDGSVKDLTVKDLPKPTIAEDDELFEQQEDYYIYEIPELAIGDELEIVSVIESKYLDNGRIVTLYQNYPALEVRYTISIPANVKLLGQIYNKMPSPKSQTVGEQVVYSWTMQNLRAIPEANSAGSIFTKDLEHFVYELNFDAFRGDASFTPKNYRDLGIQFVEDYLTIRINKKKKVEDFYATLLAGKNTPSEKLATLNDFIARKMKIVGRKELSDSDGIDDYLTNQRTDGAGVMRIYLDFFQRFGIQHYLAFAKNKFDGAFDINFLSSTQISEYFFVAGIPNEQGEETYITIMGLNGLNEIPANLTGVPFYLINLSDRNKKNLETVTFPDDYLKDVKESARKTRTQLDIRLADNTGSVKIQNVLEGYAALNERNSVVAASKADTLVKFYQRAYGNFMKTNEIQVTSAAMKEYEIAPPSPFKAEYAFTLKNVTKQQDNKTVFSLEKWIGHSLRNVVNAENRVLDYNIAYAGTDIDDLFLVFDKDVEIANLSDLNQKVDNEYVTYECKATKVNAKTYRIDSRYTIKQLFVPKDKVKLLDEANKAAEKVSKTKLQIVAK